MGKVQWINTTIYTSMSRRFITLCISDTGGTPECTRVESGGLFIEYLATRTGGAFAETWKALQSLVVEVATGGWRQLTLLVKGAIELQFRDVVRAMVLGPA